MQLTIVNLITGFFNGLKVPVGQDLLILEISVSISFRHTAVGKTPLDEWSARPETSDITHNTQKRQISMPTAGFEPTIPVSEPLQTHDLDHAASGIGFFKKWIINFFVSLWYAYHRLKSIGVNKYLQLLAPKALNCTAALTLVGTSKFDKESY